MLKKVAVTGGLSCGKSSVCRFLKELGAYVLSADTVVHQHLNPLTKLGQQVISLLGQDIVEASQINRKRIAEKVFHDSKLLRNLEKITHPVIKAEMEACYERLSEDSSFPLFVVEMPLLYEVHWEKWFDATIAVIADPEASKKRFVAQGHTIQEYEERMKFQMDPMEKAHLSTYVITNDGSIAHLQGEVQRIFTNLTKP